MKSWKYCRISFGIQARDESPPARIKFLGMSENETEVEDLDYEQIDFKIAQLGESGWELVSNTMIWGVGETSPGSEHVVNMPLGQSLMFKRQTED